MKKILLSVLVFVLMLASFIAGRMTAQPESIDRSSQVLVCVYRNETLRESPTGYIITRIPKGSQIFINRIEAPFAYISYFDGEKWLDGSITARYVGICGVENNELTKE